MKHDFLCDRAPAFRIFLANSQLIALCEYINESMKSVNIVLCYLLEFTQNMNVITATYAQVT